MLFGEEMTLKCSKEVKGMQFFFLELISFNTKFFFMFLNTSVIVWQCNHNHLPLFLAHNPYLISKSNKSLNKKKSKWHFESNIHKHIPTESLQSDLTTSDSTQKKITRIKISFVIFFTFLLNSAQHFPRKRHEN